MFCQTELLVPKAAKLEQGGKWEDGRYCHAIAKTLCFYVKVKIKRVYEGTKKDRKMCITVIRVNKRLIGDQRDRVWLSCSSYCQYLAPSKPWHISYLNLLQLVYCLCVNFKHVHVFSVCIVHWYVMVCECVALQFLPCGGSALCHPNW